MNGHERRRERKMESIKNSALKLFNDYGIKKVSIDEIAEEANVSKVTIYKYFQSKEGLYREVVKMVYQNTIDNVEKILQSKEDFLEKLKFIIFTKEQSQSLLNGKFIEDVMKNDLELQEYFNDIYYRRIKKLMFHFFDEGKAEGYISTNTSNDILFVYAEIFRSGLNAKYPRFDSIINNKKSYEQLIDLYFFGLIKRQR